MAYHFYRRVGALALILILTLTITRTVTMTVTITVTVTITLTAVSLQYKDGWRPKRTIKFCSWDGEEYGLLGSTAFADANAKWLTKSVVAYINVDIGVSGRDLFVDATPTLAHIIRYSHLHTLLEPSPSSNPFLFSPLASSIRLVSP